MPQIMARLEEKVDALTETVGKLLQGAMAPMVVTAPEEMVTVKDAASILRLSVSRVYALVQEGRIPCYKPGRNLLFLTAAAALAWKKGIRHIVIGVCEADSSGYPDCRDDAVKAMQVALNIGMNARFVIHAPLMRLDKADAWRLAEAEGGKAFVDLVRAQSHTCYLGERGQLHAWGYGCGECPACRLRAHGWEGYIAGETRA